MVRPFVTDGLLHRHPLEMDASKMRETPYGVLRVVSRPDSVHEASGWRWIAIVIGASASIKIDASRRRETPQGFCDLGSRSF